MYLVREVYIRWLRWEQGVLWQLSIKTSVFITDMQTSRRAMACAVRTRCWRSILIADKNIVGVNFRMSRLARIMSLTGSRANWFAVPR